MDLGLARRAFVVTGGTQGLGLATAEVLVAEGAKVVVCSRDAANVDEAVDRLGSNAVGVVADITDPAMPDKLTAAAISAFGRLDGAFVSHGGPPAGPATDLSDGDLEAALALAVSGPIRMVRHLASTLGEGGSIVVLTSRTSREPMAGLATSNLARPAVWGYVKTVADEVGARGVRVNVLLPGRFQTGRVDQLEASIAADRGVSTEQVRSEAVAEIPMGRVGDPSELGRVAAFLLSPAASYVTGSAWAVDGGVVRGL